VVSYPTDEIKGLKVSGKRTDFGYIVELFIPWKTFQESDVLKPKPMAITAKTTKEKTDEAQKEETLTPPPFQPGREIGIQYSLVDYDSRDEEENRPLLMSYGGRSSWGGRPDRYMNWILVEELRREEEASLNSLLFLDIPKILAQKKPLDLSVDIGQLLSPDVKSVEIKIVNSQGEEVKEEAVEVSSLPAPWKKSVKADLKWVPGEKMDELYLVSASINDKDKKTLGTVSSQLIYVGGLLNEIEAHLEAADIAALSQTEPFKAAAYLGTGAVMEKIKRYIELSNVSGMTDAILEELARLDILERGQIELEEPGLYDLLILTKNPEAQVIAEFSDTENGAATFYWGSIPLVSVRVKKLEKEDSAEYFEKRKQGIFIDISEPVKIGDLTARVSFHRYRSRPFGMDEYRSDSQVALISNLRKTVMVIDREKISHLQPKAVVIMPDSPESMKTVVEEWNNKMNIPEMSLDKALEQDNFLFVGTLAKAIPAKDMETFRIYKTEIKKQIPRIEAISSDLLLTVGCPSQKAGEKAIELVARGKPIELAEVDQIRMEILKALPEVESEISGLTEDYSLFLGDLHMHTFYSDGTPSPAGLSLQLMHCFMDYAAITDHNTIDGVRLAKYLLRKNGFDFPLTIGEEITTRLWHMNAYPLNELVSWEQSAEEAIAEGHKQNAAVHLCHPGYPNREWAKDYLKKGTKGTEFDAWEHIPEKYDEWKEQGILPVIVGTTDTHSGLFYSPERTIVFAPSAGGDEVAEAIRQNRVIAVSSSSGEHFFYGSDKMVSLALRALREGKKLKSFKVERLKKTLKNANLVGLLKSSHSKREDVDEIIEK
jgi:hypothetical protein